MSLFFFFGGGERGAAIKLCLILSTLLWVFEKMAQKRVFHNICMKTVCIQKMIRKQK